jgi:hypothetical protein
MKKLLNSEKFVVFFKFLWEKQKNGKRMDIRSMIFIEFKQAKKSSEKPV